MEHMVSFKSGTGHDDLDAKNSQDEPSIYQFDTKAEADAFVKGVYLAAQALNGWLDGWVEVKHI